MNRPSSAALIAPLSVRDYADVYTHGVITGEAAREALSRLALPPVPVEQLTRLFELARFSDHSLEPGELDRARTCLEEIRAALEPEGADHVRR